MGRPRMLTVIMSEEQVQLLVAALEVALRSPDFFAIDEATERRRDELRLMRDCANNSVEVQKLASPELIHSWMD